MRLIRVCVREADNPDPSIIGGADADAGSHGPVVCNRDPVG